MQVLSKEQYVSTISDIEKAYLISIKYGKAYLRADIEKAGDIGLRIEMMDFELDTSYGFYKANNICRNNYSGGISFIEYDSFEEAERSALNDFLRISDNAIFLFCDDNELNELMNNYSDDIDIYVVTYRNKQYP